MWSAGYSTFDLAYQPFSLRFGFVTTIGIYLAYNVFAPETTRLQNPKPVPGAAHSPFTHRENVLKSARQPPFSTSESRIQRAARSSRPLPIPGPFRTLRRRAQWTTARSPSARAQIDPRPSTGRGQISDPKARGITRAQPSTGIPLSSSLGREIWGSRCHRRYRLRRVHESCRRRRACRGCGHGSHSAPVFVGSLSESNTARYQPQRSIKHRWLLTGGSEMWLVVMRIFSGESVLCQ